MADADNEPGDAGAEEGEEEEEEEDEEEEADRQGHEEGTESVTAEEQGLGLPETVDDSSSEGDRDRDRDGADAAAEKEKLANLLAARSALKRKNVYLLKKLFTHCKKKKIGGVLGGDEATGQGADSQEKYQEKLELYFGLKQGVEEEEAVVRSEMGELQRLLSERESEATDANDSLTKLQTSVGRSLVQRRTGRQLSNKTIERMINEQNLKMGELTEARMKYIKLKNLVEKKRRQLADMEQVDSGLCLQDFKQLERDRQVLDLKIEDKRSELTSAELKMRLGQETERRLKGKTLRAHAAAAKARLICSQTERRLREAMEKLDALKCRRDALKQDEVPSLKHNALSAYPVLVEDFDLSMKQMEGRQTRLEGLRANQWEIGRGIRNTRRRIQILCRQRKGLALSATQSPTTPIGRSSDTNGQAECVES